MKCAGICPPFGIWGIIKTSECLEKVDIDSWESKQVKYKEERELLQETTTEQCAESGGLQPSVLNGVVMKPLLQGLGSEAEEVGGKEPPHTHQD